VGVNSGDNSSYSRLLINNESEIYDDILQVEVVESYWNNTFKVLALYEWLALKCYSAQFILKLDDDVYFNLKLFMQQILSKPLDECTFYGFASWGGKLPTKANSKQYIPPDIYPYKKFNFLYVYGFAALSSVKHVIDIQTVASCIRGIFVDDVYLKGYVNHIIGGKVENLKNLNSETIFKRGKISKLNWEYISKFTISPQLTTSEMLQIYNEMIVSKAFQSTTTSKGLLNNTQILNSTPLKSTAVADIFPKARTRLNFSQTIFKISKYLLN